MTDILKFSFIALCFTVAMFSYRFCLSKKDWLFLAVGMTFTLVSDYFLVLRNNQPVGFTTFCLVHIAYIMRVKDKKYGWIIAGTLALAVPLYFILDYLIATATLYLVLFLQDIAANAVNYRRNRFPKRNRQFMLAGILLFALCDINVLLYNLPRYISLPEWLAEMGFVLIWVFYAPAQGLLALSAARFPLKHHLKGI